MDVVKKDANILEEIENAFRVTMNDERLKRFGEDHFGLNLLEDNLSNYRVLNSIVDHVEGRNPCRGKIMQGRCGTI